MPTTGLPPLGATITAEGTQFAVWSRNAARIDLCLFDKTGARQLRQLPMLRNGDVHTLTVADAPKGTRYGFRADGVYSPDHGLWFDPFKEDLEGFIACTSARTTGTVRLRLFKGSATVIGRSSPWALYSEELASFDNKSFDQRESTGTVKTHGLQARMYRALRDRAR